MGVFKDIKNLRELSAHRGGRPTMREGFARVRALADDRGEREVLDGGIPAKAVAKGFAEQVPGDRFAMRIPLEVHPPGGRPYDVEYVFPTARMTATLSIGMEIPVKIHPEDPNRIAVRWDAQRAAITAAGGDMAAVTQGLQATYSLAANDALAAARDAGAAEDPLEKIKKLGQMRDAGLITDAEFTQKKTELLKQA